MCPPGGQAEGEGLRHQLDTCLTDNHLWAIIHPGAALGHQDLLLTNIHPEISWAASRIFLSVMPDIVNI